MRTNHFTQRAVTLAFALHGEQTRKASIIPNAPYISHLMEVAGMVAANGGDDETVAAALLHDAIEDQGAETRDAILEQCGPRVLALVEECTEAGTGGATKAPWRARKESYLAHIAEASPEALLISVADKLQSARELKRQVRRQGDDAYSFSGAGKEGQLWFHNALVDAYYARIASLEGGEYNLAGIKALIDDFCVVAWLIEYEC